jgi:molybdopterin synthase sulfur carrier subunit
VIAVERAAAIPEPMAEGDPEPVVVRLTPLLLTLFPTAERRLQISAATVTEMIDALDARWPGMRDRICDSTPAIRPHMNVFVDNERADLHTRLRPGADVFILTAISGG